jgi:hypothetical protein
MGLGFGIRDSDSGIHGSKRNRIPDSDPQHWFRIRLRIRLSCDYWLIFACLEICKKETRIRTTAMPRYITKCII